MTDHNKGETPKSDKSKISSDRYIPQINSPDGYTEQQLRDKLKQANKRIRELEEQLADANVIIKNLEP